MPSDIQSQAIPTIRKIMAAFAADTGLTGTSAPITRYLWTDAFAVCNFLELYRQTGETIHLEMAQSLVDQVHFVLGRYSDGDSRSGWISGLDEETGYRHPTAGGLRIGKKLGEREPEEPLDEQREWDRDGQYFHYLTKWMHALSRVAAVTDDGRYHRWALELARSSHAGFSYTVSKDTPKRMYWKMSIDLSRPLINSMGQHDPLDALISYEQLELTRDRYSPISDDISLEGEIRDCRAMCAGKTWATADPLGAGMLLADVYRLAQIMPGLHSGCPLTPSTLLADCKSGLHTVVNSGLLHQLPKYRLAFRELGLSIGLRSIERMRRLVDKFPDRFASDRDLAGLLASLAQYDHLPSEIERYWLSPAHQQYSSWIDHQDINAVMLATSLAPDGYLLVV